MSAIVDIVVPTYGQPEFTAKCFQSISMTTEPGQVKLIWVDNGSNPMERIVMAEAMRDTGLVRQPIYLPENLGFVKATNCGIAVSTAPYVLLLNNDTELQPYWLPKLLEPMEKDPKVGLVGPLSSSPHQWQGGWEDGEGWVRLPESAMLAFFCTLIRRKVIEDCGYLSEQYRAGLGDDDDYCEVVKKAGWRLALRQDLRILHHHRTTFAAVYGPDGWLQYQAENLAHFKRKFGK